MLNVNKILFPTDFSGTAEAAFAHALRLARRYDAALHVLNVSEERKAVPRLADRLEHLERQAGGDVPVTSAHVKGRVAASILTCARERGTDLIVMGTRGQSGLRRLVMGSVAEEVVRRAPCPVFTVRHKKRKTATPEDVIERLLVPVDFSASSRPALAHAKELAATYDARIDVLHITSHPDLRTGFTAGAEPAGPSQRERQRRQLDALAREAGLEAADLYVEYSYPHGGILDFAGRHSTDLIVIATHGRTGLEHFTMGSVAEKVVRMAPCPVFTIPTFGKSLVRASAPEAREAASE